MYFLSSVFTVMLFFIFASFVNHPKVLQGEIPSAVGQALIACNFIIVIFSFFFVLYSSSTFLRTRQKEFGLFSLYGMTNGQIRLFVIIENLLISLLSIGTGIILGLLFSKLFYMAIGAILKVDNPIPFILIPKAILLTIICFFTLFLGINLMSLVRIRKFKIIDQLKASRKPKPFPIYSKWLVALTILCLGGGYAIAWITNINLVMITMLPTIGIVVLGTYFLFTQSSVALINGLQKNKSIFYKKTRMITISQLIFKLKDNARTLFLVAVLTAVTLSASGTMYSFHMTGKSQIMAVTPYSFDFYELGRNTHNVIKPEKIDKILAQHNVNAHIQDQLIGVIGKYAGPENQNQWTWIPKSYFLLSNSIYNQRAKDLGFKPITIEPGHGTFINMFREMNLETKKNIPIQVNETTIDLIIDQQLKNPILNSHIKLPSVLIVSDTLYEEIVRTTPVEDQIVIYGYELSNWENCLTAVQEIEKNIPEEMSSHFAERVITYSGIKKITSTTLFIGMFISVLFFIASGSIIYFKLFTELQQDQTQIEALRRIGATKGEIQKVVTDQIGIIFFLPFLVGTIHATFALKTLSNLLERNIFQDGMLVVLFYLTFQTLFFFFAKIMYTKQAIKFE